MCCTQYTQGPAKGGGVGGVGLGGWGALEHSEQETTNGSALNGRDIKRQ